MSRESEIEKIARIGSESGYTICSKLIALLVDKGIGSEKRFEIKEEYLVAHSMGEILEQDICYVQPINYDKEKK